MPMVCMRAASSGGCILPPMDVLVGVCPGGAGAGEGSIKCTLLGKSLFLLLGCLHLELPSRLVKCHEL